MTTASVAVIGGGVMGASVAYHLAARGWREHIGFDPSPGLADALAATHAFTGRD